MKCENCDVTFGYLRLKSREWICRKCGHATPENHLRLIKNFMGFGNEPKKR